MWINGAVYEIFLSGKTVLQYANYPWNKIKKSNPLPIRIPILRLIW